MLGTLAALGLGLRNGVLLGLHLLRAQLAARFIATVQSCGAILHLLLAIHGTVAALLCIGGVRSVLGAQVIAQLAYAFPLLAFLALACFAHELFGFLLLARIDGGVHAALLVVGKARTLGGFGCFARQPVLFGQDAIDLIDLGQRIGILGHEVAGQCVQAARLLVLFGGQCLIALHKGKAIALFMFLVALAREAIALFGKATRFSILLLPGQPFCFQSCAFRITRQALPFGFFGSKPRALLFFPPALFGKAFRFAAVLVAARQFGIDGGNAVLRIFLLRLHTKGFGELAARLLELVLSEGDIASGDQITIARFDRGFLLALAPGFFIEPRLFSSGQLGSKAVRFGFAQALGFGIGGGGAIGIGLARDLGKDGLDLR